MFGLLALTAVAAAPLTVGADAWFVEDAVVTTAAAEVHLTRGYGFPLLDEGRPVGWAWAGDGEQRTGPGADPAALAGIVTRELGGSLSPDGGWTTPVDVVYAVGGGAPIGGRGWTRVGAWEDDGAGGATVTATPRSEIAAARLALQLAVPPRTERLPELGYPLADLVLDPDPGRALIEARVPGNVSRLAGNDERAERGWLTTLHGDPALTPGSDSTLVFGTRWVFPPADC